jgi:hypothetical protein
MYVPNFLNIIFDKISRLNIFQGQLTQKPFFKYDNDYIL